ncbi:MAG: glutamine-hydrolyzing GMP synthase [Psittacicella sp.]
MKSNPEIIILNYGARYINLVKQYVTNLDVSCEIVNWDISCEELCKINPKGIILSGGPKSVTENDSPYLPDHVLNYNVPILGICYGMQTMADRLGGKVIKAEKAEFGKREVNQIKTNKLLSGVHIDNHKMEMWMEHYDRVAILPKGFTNYANTLDCPYQMIMDDSERLFGIQFHPELEGSVNGGILFKNFVKDICKI